MRQQTDATAERRWRQKPAASQSMPLRSALSPAGLTGRQSTDDPQRAVRLTGRSEGSATGSAEADRQHVSAALRLLFGACRVGRCQRDPLWTNEL